MSDDDLVIHPTCNHEWDDEKPKGTTYQANWSKVQTFQDLIAAAEERGYQRAVESLASEVEQDPGETQYAIMFYARALGMMRREHLEQALDTMWKKHRRAIIAAVDRELAERKPAT